MLRNCNTDEDMGKVSDARCRKCWREGNNCKPVDPLNQFPCTNAQSINNNASLERNFRTRFQNTSRTERRKMFMLARNTEIFQSRRLYIAVICLSLTTYRFEEMTKSRIACPKKIHGKLRHQSWMKRRVAAVSSISSILGKRDDKLGFN